MAAEHQLREGVAFRRAMGDPAATGLRARDLDGRVTFVNPAFCRMVGLPEAALACRTLASAEESLAFLSSGGADALSPPAVPLDVRLVGAMGDRLGIALRTVEVYRERIFEKAGVKNAVELARLFGGRDGS